MPYDSLESAPANWRTHKDGALSLEQINKLASIYDAIKQGGEADNPAAVAWSQWEKLYELKGDKWVKLSEFAEAGNDELRDVEIMATGTWKGFKFTPSDIDNIVNNFSKVNLRVPLKLGHGKQVFAQKEGRPAFGWVKELKRVGEKLMATFSDIPLKLMELIKRKNYIRFSSEIRRDYLHNGNTYGNVLSGVALLGEEIPAVQSLDDIYNLHVANATTYSDTWKEEGEVIYTEEGDADMKEVEDLKAQLDAKSKEAESLAAEKKALEQKIVTLSEEQASVANENKRREIYAKIDEGIKAMKIAPAAREALAAICFKAEDLIDGVHEFSEGDKKLKLEFSNVTELISKFTESQPQALKTDENAESREKKNIKNEEQVGSRVYYSDEELHERIQKYATEHKISYIEAAEKVEIELVEEKREKEEVD